MESRIRNYELAARMQLNATGVLDLSQESQETLKLYGLEDPNSWKPIEGGSDQQITPAGYAQRCLMSVRAR